MTESSTTVPLRDIHSSFGTQKIEIAGLPSGRTSSSGSTSAKTTDPGTFAQPEALFPRPLPTRFTVTVTDNILLQLWEGTVLSAHPDEFTALLRDKTDENHPDEEVALGYDEVDPADM